MAGAIFGGAVANAFIQTAVDRLASREVLNFFRERRLDEKLLSKLNASLLSIDALADDAELKQFSDPHVRNWLCAVKDAVLDAEHLLDEIDYELIKCQVEAEAGSESESQTTTSRVSNILNPTKVSNFFKTTFSPLNKKINSEMKQVLEQLEYLESKKGALGLKKASCPRVGSGSREQSSLLGESVIYGRDGDRDIIFDWLTSQTNKPSILAVVGMGGLGKTTLARHVYNDPRMEKANFSIKAWVCVSDDFDVLSVTRKILGAITKKNDDSEDLEMVHGRLKEELEGKKFLLVLDDVWNERQGKWEAVQTPLTCGDPGSIILVTTRSDKVASTMRSHIVHHLKQLEEDHCWQVFAKHAFQDDNLPLDADLEKIAKKIIDKCKGLPLALKTIGSLLRTKSSISEWESVLGSNIWDLEDSEIIPALRLSYHHLPSNLKRCFAYCSIFPKDYEFDKWSLIQLWMAQKFLQCPHQSRSPEEVGEQYFDDLLSKSFFQQSSRRETLFVMHDLLNDLANYVYGDICFRLGVDKAESVPKTTRHFSFAINFDGFGSLPDAKRLRTFLPTTGGGTIYVGSWKCKISIDELFSKFKFLHVLSLSDCNLGEVPDTLGELKHLRSLDLSLTNIERLPDSTCLLYNLQTLRLNYCHCLEELPKELYRLTNLRYLEFISTAVRTTPMHFGRLKNLQVVDLFYVGKSSEFSIQQLGGLNLHRGLSIMELQNIVNPSDAKAADLINKTRLEKLSLEWNENNIPGNSSKEKEVLEKLQPSKHLKDLSIGNYGGTQFASWLSDDSLPNVVSLELKHCKYCQSLPSLGRLPSLKKLTITGFDGIVHIGAEFYGNSSSSFPSLETLHFKNMKEWEEWECKAAFPHLQFLYIYDCPKLKGVKGLSEQLLHLKKLHISSCERVNIPMSNCYDFLVTLKIGGSCDSLTTFPLDFFPKLCSLELKSCCNLQMISQEHTHKHLKKMKIKKCPQFESLPQRMHVLLSSLGDLRVSIEDCPKLTVLSEHLLHSNDLHIINCRRLTICEHSMEDTISNASLKLLDISGCPIINIPMRLCYDFLGLLAITDSCDSLTTLPLDIFPSLCSLKITGCRNLQMISQEHPHNHLYDLEIVGCPQYKSLPKDMHIRLPSVAFLKIKDCPQVEMFSDGGLPSNLKYLWLSNCSKLIPSVKGILEANTSIEFLTIGNVDVESFPERFLPLSLTSLYILNCPDLKKLNYNGLCRLSSLTSLSVAGCPNLQCLPEEGLPKSISCLVIECCPLLKQRCQKPDGKDWGKIAHIEDRMFW